MSAMPRLPPVTAIPNPPAPTVEVRLLRPTVSRVALVIVVVPRVTATELSLIAKFAEPVITLKRLSVVSEPLTTTWPVASWIVNPAIGITGAVSAVLQFRAVAAWPPVSVPPAWLIATVPFWIEAVTEVPSVRVPDRPVPTTATQ